MSFLIKPSGRSRAYKIVLRVAGFDKPIKFQAERDLGGTVRLQGRLDLLARAKSNGDQPPTELANWINNLKQKRADKLVSLGLLDRRRFEGAKALTVHLPDYEAAVRARRSNTPAHAKKQRGLVERLCTALKADYFADLRAHDVEVKLSEWGKSASTRRHYIVALRDFAEWMVRDKRAMHNHLEGIVPPRPSEGHDRRPLTHEEFEQLWVFLGALDLRPGQQFPWTGKERRLIYWTAVFTGLRQNELASRCRHHLHLDDTPAWVEIKGEDTKNGEWGGIHIPGDLAAELRAHVAEMAPAARVFKFPLHSGTTVDTLRKDLEEAGVAWDRGDGKTVDFHTLRSTAITWWLLTGMKAVEVQRIARLKTLAMVQRYSRNFDMQRTDWLDKLPRFGAGGAADGLGRKLG